MKPNVDYTLYLVTDSALMTTATVEESVELAIRGGATLVQLREKTASSRECYATALAVCAVCRRHRVPLIINDRVDLALAVDADGVHIGQSDLPAQVVRRLIGPDKLLGVSAGTLPQALAAVEAGADYLGIGAMCATGTKTDASLTSMATLSEIRAAVSLPLVVIGGVNRENACEFARVGVDGLAVVSAIVAQRDITAAAREIKAAFLGGRPAQFLSPPKLEIAPSM
ncbi:thiamine phosphate synthase [Ruminococcaceae bacterium OttesenSCG-928-L11]|nr:thiamine phosphate synthase [Ruminococcaceae bacterium OttesenSCG-928-L11]